MIQCTKMKSKFEKKKKIECDIIYSDLQQSFEGQKIT